MSLLKCSEQLSSGKKPVLFDFQLQTSEPDDQGGEAFPLTLSPDECDQTPVQESPNDNELLELSPDNEEKIRIRIDNQYQRFQ